MLDENSTILAIETATNACCVGLLHQQSIIEQVEEGNNIHSQVLLKMIDDLLQQKNITVNELDVVAVDQGPGSFTGLRIGIGVAQGIAYGVGCPMIGVSSLDALANQAEEDGTVIAGVDARMGEVYWCEYHKQADVVTRKQALTVSPPQDIEANDKVGAIQLLGNAWQEYQGQFDEALIKKANIDTKQVYPSADSLLVIAQQAYQRGELTSPIEFAPEYVRNDVAKKSTKKY